MANQLIKIASDITYRQIVILYVQTHQQFCSSLRPLEIFPSKILLHQRLEGRGGWRNRGAPSAAYPGRRNLHYRGAGAERRELHRGLHGDVQGHRREDQQPDPGYGDDGFQSVHKHLRAVLGTIQWFFIRRSCWQVVIA